MRISFPDETKPLVLFLNLIFAPTELCSVGAHDFVLSVKTNHSVHRAELGGAAL